MADALLPIGEGLSLWYHVWGNPDGTPVLFVHGGPGQCVADYGGINAKFFDADKFRVVEVDQRGTGLSQPSPPLCQRALPPGAGEGRHTMNP